MLQALWGCLSGRKSAILGAVLFFLLPAARSTLWLAPLEAVTRSTGAADNTSDFRSELLSASGVGIAQSVERRKARVRFPAVYDFSLLHNIETDCGAHPAS
jgi:hypothetical protein